MFDFSSPYIESFFLYLWLIVFSVYLCVCVCARVRVQSMCLFMMSLWKHSRFYYYLIDKSVNVKILSMLFVVLLHILQIMLILLNAKVQERRAHISTTRVRTLARAHTDHIYTLFINIIYSCMGNCMLPVYKLHTIKRNWFILLKFAECKHRFPIY